MGQLWITTVRERRQAGPGEGGGVSARVIEITGGRPRPLARLLLLAAGAALAVLALLVAIPLILAGLVLFAGAALVLSARAWVRGLRGPRGRLDQGRRNVRVIDPSRS